ncbi:hypothetical protein GCM10023149_54550 [Mucilaginibacter gynuensis]|uniref:Peptidase S9A N-terminal domain-containing protein n=1 Tax=Mucilaginibacter gynuensis TaxID=1302236 RepID=A0ABP8HPG2_9SPHI
MKKALSLFIATFFCGALHAQAPASPKKPVNDTYFGLQVTDNYRWLEDTKDTVVKTWFKAQADYTNAQLGNISGRDSLIKTFQYYNSLKPYSIGSNIIKKGGRFFYKKTLATENVGKLYYRTGENGNEVLLYDPVPVDGKAYSINYYLPSEDGKKIAFGISVSGSETSTIYIMNVDTKKLYPEKIFPSWFGVSSWTPDSKGFVYTVQNSSDITSMSSMTDTRSMYHQLGTATSTDKLLFSRIKYPKLSIKPEDLCFVFYSEDMQYIFGYLGGVDRDMNCFYAPAADLLKPVISWKRLFKKDDHVTNFFNHGDDIYMLTYAGHLNLRSPNQT